MIDFEGLLRKLTDAYYKKPIGTLGKILRIIHSEFREPKKALEDIKESRSINKARGSTLDHFGQDVRASRRGADDVEYRRYIKIKIIANLSGGEIETLNEVLPIFMEGAFLGVRETWKLEKYDYEPAAIVIRYDDQALFDELENDYEEAESDPWFLDGLYFLDDDRELDGGVADLEATMESRIESIKNIKRDTKQIVGGGIHVYFEIPQEVISVIEAEQSTKVILNSRASNKVESDNTVKNTATHKVTQSPVHRLDGAYYLDGHVELNAVRPFAVHDVDITEVSA